jgi:hypothetical protein
MSAMVAHRLRRGFGPGDRPDRQLRVVRVMMDRRGALLASVHYMSRIAPKMAVGDGASIGSVRFGWSPTRANDGTVWNVGERGQDSVEGVHKFDSGCRRQSQPARHVNGGSVARLDATVDELRDDARTAHQDGDGAAIERRSDRFVGVNLPDVGVVDYAWLPGSFGHWKTPCGAMASPEHQTDRGIVTTPVCDGESVFPASCPPRRR